MLKISEEEYKKRLGTTQDEVDSLKKQLNEIAKEKNIEIFDKDEYMKQISKSLDKLIPVLEELQYAVSETNSLSKK